MSGSKQIGWYDLKKSIDYKIHTGLLRKIKKRKK